MQDKLLNFVLKTLMPNSEEKTLPSHTRLNTIRGWDSLSLLSLITELQKEYGIKISIEEAISLNSIEDVVQIITKKIHDI